MKQKDKMFLRFGIGASIATFIVFLVYNSGFLFMNRKNLAIRYIEDKYHREVILDRTEPWNEGDMAETFFLHFKDESSVQFGVRDNGIIFPHFMDDYRAEHDVAVENQVLKTLEPAIEKLGFTNSSASTGIYGPDDSFPIGDNIFITVNGSVNTHNPSEPNRILELVKTLQRGQPSHLLIKTIFIRDATGNETSYLIDNVSSIKTLVDVKLNFYVPNDANPVPNQMYYPRLRVW